MSGNRFNPLGSGSKLPSTAPGGPSVPAPQPAEEQRRPQPKKRKGHRGGKKKRSRRKSFAVLDEDGQDDLAEGSGDGFYQLPAANLSGTSVDSDLLDHREQKAMRVRRSSTVPTPGFQVHNPFAGANRLRNVQADSGDEENQRSPWGETAPLLSDSARSLPRNSQQGFLGYGATREPRGSRPQSGRASSRSSRTKTGGPFGGKSSSYDVNHPPSIPGSPTFPAADRLDLSFGDVMIRDELDMRGDSPEPGEADDTIQEGASALRDNRPEINRRMPSKVEGDVCFPGPGMSEIGEEESQLRGQEPHQYRTRRRRGQWPDLSILDEWKHFEKEDRSEERRVKTITEPQLINGRLRPVRKGWFQTDEDAPYRFTYFNEEFQSTIHSQSISELVQPGGGFQELFIPDPPILSDDETDSEDESAQVYSKTRHPSGGMDLESRFSTRQPSLSDSKRERPLSPPKEATTSGSSRNDSGRATPIGVKSPPEDSTNKPSQSSGVDVKEKVVRYGERPVWWLDIFCPTEAEMKVISKAFGIHPLTAEDIMLQEAREKVELFRHYYFVNYRTFDQDINSENYLEPVNMYVVVFREGVLSFHFSMTPHPANVRRRIRQLKDYLILSSDWISYAIIDDITDVFQPLIQNIEDEVDDIDEAILRLHSSSDKRLKEESAAAQGADDSSGDPSGDMLRRVGDCRKRVMSLYRLLGNKADVIKGFAKRCNERWEVAPRSEIGLYLGDIQDHIVTMTSNLGHYEKLLARSHGNYLAQINIRMNERQEQTADVLGKLTVLGTIVLPMNIITGLWGMNVWVPGQEYEGDLQWFAWITVGLVFFGVSCYLIAKRVYKIV